MLAPDLWKRAVRFISRFPSEKIRYIGLESVVLVHVQRFRLQHLCRALYDG